MEYLRSQYDEILNILEKKENKIVDLEFELLSMDHQKHDRSFGEKGDIGTEKRSSFYKQELQDKNREIEKLNGELKKCTCYLQEIVNTELWDKNRQIEKLQSKQDNTTEVMRLKKELTGKDSQLKLLKEKICELGLDIQLPDESFECKSLCSPKRNIEHIKALQVNDFTFILKLHVKYQFRTNSERPKKSGTTSKSELPSWKQRKSHWKNCEPRMKTLKPN